MFVFWDGHNVEYTGDNTHCFSIEARCNVVNGGVTPDFDNLHPSLSKAVLLLTNYIIVLSECLCLCDCSKVHLMADILYRISCEENKCRDHSIFLIRVSH